MNRVRISVGAVASGVLLFGAVAAAETYHKSATPRILSDWNDSDDGKVSICLTVNKSTFSSAEVIVIRCALRNNTENTLLILRPFGDVFYAESAGLSILGPDGEIEYIGVMKEYILGTGSFYELKPGMVIDETYSLRKEVLKGLGEAGLYRIRYNYYSMGYPKRPKPEQLWEGNILSSTVHMMIMDKKPNKASEDIGASAPNPQR